MMPKTVYDPGLADITAAAAAAYRARDDAAVVRLLADAILRVPQRLDLQYCLAGFHIQTGRPDLALPIYREILEVMPHDVEARLCVAHWTRYRGDLAGAEKMRRHIRDFQPGKAADLGKIWLYIDAWGGSPVTDSLPRPADGRRRAAILVLGYVLNPDGGMQEELVRRLEKGLEAAELFPDAPIVVTGGVPRSGKVEAVEMRNWLAGRGVPEERIFVEGYARDVVENLLYSRYILDMLAPELVVAVTSARNVRRVGAALEIVGWTGGSGWQVAGVAATREGFRDDSQDSLKTYRDVLRAYGVRMMQVYPEFTER